jgi:hypothetical protein
MIAFEQKPYQKFAVVGIGLFPDTPEESAWPVVAEAKDVARWGARSAECVAGFDTAGNDAIS